MGTSSSGGGPRPTTPLIPSWIPSSPTPEPPPPEDDENDGEPREVPEAPSPVEHGNRFNASRRDFSKYVKGKGKNPTLFKNALRDYIKTSSGGSGSLARRMKPATSRVTSFYNVLTSFQGQGKDESLKSYNLSDYSDRSLLEVLSALMDEVFKGADNSFDDIQDDSITKQAYANTISRIAREENDINLDKLTNDNIDTMIAIFIEETIVNRVICDIGKSMVEKLPNPKDVLEMENSVYQIVSGLVRNKIMTEIKNVRRGTIADIENKIENIYRITFDTILGLN